MRYHCTSWSDVNLAIEAFTHARRALLVVLAVALPFAAWETVHSDGTHTITEDSTQVQMIQPVQAVEPVHSAETLPAVRT